MTRGDETKTIILATGLQMASTLSLEAVTIGALAKRIQMSKSGLFAHFNSKENLQIEILKYAETDFIDHVIMPAIKTTAGIPRIKKLVERWINWGSILAGGCIFVTASTEYADRPGKVREYLLKQQKEWIYSLMRFAESATKAGDFRKDIDREQFAYDLYSLLLGFHYYHQLLRDKKTKIRQEKSLEDLLAKYMKVQG
jgi:AcrR family transcriptional regulator